MPNNLFPIIVSDPAPIVIPFGARGSGKTCALVRLIRYLFSQGYTYDIDHFLVNNIPGYHQDAAIFNDWIHNIDIIPDATSLSAPLLIKIRYRGSDVCQFLDMPGDIYFNPNNSHRVTSAFHPLLQQISMLPNKKIWMYLTVADWMSNAMRIDYVERIRHCMNLLYKNNDKHIVVYNMVDKPHVTSMVLSQGIFNKAIAEKRMLSEYPHIEKIFPVSVLRKLIYGRGYKFVAFSSSTFPVNPATGRKTFVNYRDEFPKDLWKTILRYL